MAIDRPLRLVIDPNIIGSVLLGGVSRKRYLWLLDNLYQFDICYSDQLLTEIRHFADVPFFQKKQLTSEVLESFIDSFRSYCLKINVTSQVRLGRDSQDYYLLSLCRDARAAYLITGDPDLLTIGSYAQAQIVSFKTFVELYS